MFLVATNIKTNIGQDIQTSPIMAWNSDREVQKKVLETKNKGRICMASEEYYDYGEEGEYTFPISFDKKFYKENFSVVPRPLEMQQPQRFFQNDSEYEGRIMYLSRSNEEKVRISALMDGIIPSVSQRC